MRWPPPFRRVPPPWRSNPRPWRGGSGRKPHVFWANSFLDSAGGTSLNGSSATPFVPVYTYPVNYNAGGLSADPSELGEELTLRRAIGHLRYQVVLNPSVTSYICIHWGLALADIEPTTGNVGEDALTLNPSTAAGLQARRWLAQGRFYLGQFQSGGTTVQPQLGSTDMLVEQGRPTFDLSLKGLRIRDTQRLVLVEAVEQSGASDVGIVKRWGWMRFLLQKRV